MNSILLLLVGGNLQNAPTGDALKLFSKVLDASFSDIPPETIQQAVMIHLNSSPFWPTIADLNNALISLLSSQCGIENSTAIDLYQKKQAVLAYPPDNRSYPQLSLFEQAVIHNLGGWLNACNGTPKDFEQAVSTVKNSFVTALKAPVTLRAKQIERLGWFNPFLLPAGGKNEG